MDGSEQATDPKRPRLLGARSQPPQTLRLIRGRRVVADAEDLFEPGYVVVVGGRVAEVGSDEACSALAPACTEIHEADLVVPGFIDIHTHGIGGADEIADFWRHPKYTLSRVVKYGTTALLATMVIPKDVSSGPEAQAAASVDCLCANAFGGCSCQAIAPNVADAVPQVAAVLNDMVGKLGHGAVLEGIHAEGPVIATLGGLPTSDSNMSLGEFKRLLDLLGGGLKIMTISPSLESKADVPYQRLKLLLERGIRPALGHDTGCTLEDILGALRVAAYQGSTLHITHGFNVQRFHHRDSGLGNIAMLPRTPALPNFEGVSLPTVEVIGDSVHVSPLVLQSFCTCKSPGTACFITDGIAEPTPGATISYAGRIAQIKVQEGQAAVYSSSAVDGREVLIGSCIMIVDAFRTAVTVLGVDLRQAVDMCCCTPAAVASLPHVGKLRPGCRADVVMLDDSLTVQQVLVAGSLVHDCSTG